MAITISHFLLFRLAAMLLLFAARLAVASCIFCLSSFGLLSKVVSCLNPNYKQANWRVSPIISRKYFCLGHLHKWVRGQNWILHDPAAIHCLHWGKCKNCKHKKNDSSETTARGTSDWTLLVWVACRNTWVPSHLFIKLPVECMHFLPFINYQRDRIGDLTFVNDSEDDLAVAAVHIWTVTHLADVGAIEGRGHFI